MKTRTTQQLIWVLYRSYCKSKGLRQNKPESLGKFINTVRCL